jgi:hypothetical protein
MLKFLEMQKPVQSVALESVNGVKHPVAAVQASIADADRIALFAIDPHRELKS